VGWKENVTLVSNNANYPFVVKKDINLVAEFTSTASVNNQVQNQIALYPNPTNGVVNIRTDVSIDAITIIDITGKEMLKLDRQSFLQNGNSINISRLCAGMYVVEVLSNSAKAHFSLVKE